MVINRCVSNLLTGVWEKQNSRHGTCVSGCQGQSGSLFVRGGCTLGISFPEAMPWAALEGDCTKEKKDFQAASQLPGNMDISPDNSPWKT